MKTVLKVTRIIFGILVIAIIIGIIWFVATICVNSKVHKPKEVKFDTNSNMNALLIYQPSKHDTTKNIAYAVADEFKTNGYNVTVNYPSDKLSYDLEKYDVIIFGTPIYAGKPSKVLCDYIKKNQFSGKSVFIFATGASPDVITEIEEVEGLLQEGNDVFKIKVAKGEEEKIKDFVKINLLS